MPRKKTKGITPELLIETLAALFSGCESEHEETVGKEEEVPRRGRGRTTAKKPDNLAVLKDLSEKFKKEFSIKELKELLEDIAGVTTVSKVPDDAIDEVIGELEAELENSGVEEDDSEVTIEAVKIAVQAFQKKNGKEETEEILEDYGIKSVRSLGKLEQSQLEDLYADVTED